MSKGVALEREAVPTRANDRARTRLIAFLLGGLTVLVLASYVALGGLRGPFGLLICIGPGVVAFLFVVVVASMLQELFRGREKTVR